MALNPSPKVAEARKLADQWEVDQVIILTFNHQKETMQCISYGRTSELCQRAKNYAGALWEVIQDLGRS